jgi:hypothetical protein
MGDSCAAPDGEAGLMTGAQANAGAALDAHTLAAVAPKRAKAIVVSPVPVPPAPGPQPMSQAHMAAANVDVGNSFTAQDSLSLKK